MGQTTGSLSRVGALIMQCAVQSNTLSWRSGVSPMVLSDIFSADNSVTIWKRDIDLVVNNYFERAFKSLGMGVRGVFAIERLKCELSAMLPEQEGKQVAVDDIYLLSDMLTCLFDCQSVGLRLVPLQKAMCPKFHVDNVPVRLVNTYLGSGTEWLPLEATKPRPGNGLQHQTAKTPCRWVYDKSSVQQMQAFDVGLLKGQAWENHEHMAAIHRSCQLEESEKRVLLTLDPM